jgi:hypothetical protein
MSRGNINYKYLKRRKNWFQRNWQAVLIYAGIVIVILALLAVAVFAVLKFTPVGDWFFEMINL